jgi:type I restriction enzyme R subunit
VGCGVVDEKEHNRAGSGDDLPAMMAENKPYVFSLIHKFNKEIKPGDAYSERDDIIVIIDEAHRSQYGTFAMNMRRALPNASYIGFTGTPLFKNDDITNRVFGEHVSTYDFQRAVEDGATVPLYYDARGEKLGVAIKNVNERIAQKLEEIEIEGIDVEQRLERELSRDYHIITADKRLEQIAKDFVEHYSTNWELGKAMFICIDKTTCVKMHGLIEKYWKEKIKELQAKMENMPHSEEKNELSKKIKWMKATITAVVVSEEQGEVDKFRKSGLDITPHRKLMKEGMDVPEWMQKLPKYLGRKTLSLDEAFKAEEHPFRIAIVCAMWLTGFDVPSLSTLYLDKPMKEHTLMQAIARANRVHEGKNNGLIVDYIGLINKYLREALATFAVGNMQDDVTPEPAKPEGELLEELEEAIKLVKDFLEEKEAPYNDILKKSGFERNAAINGCKEVINENDRSRKKFGIMAREVFKKYKACLTVEGIGKYKKDRDTINIIYKSLQRDVEKADISDIIHELHKVVDEAIDIDDQSEVDEPGKPIDISKIDFDLLRKEFEKSPRKNTTVQKLKHVVEERLQMMLKRNPLRTDFQKRYENIVEEYNREKDQAVIEKAFAELMKLTDDLSKEEKRCIEENLDEETLAIFDLLKKKELNKKEIARIKEVAETLLKTLKEERLNVDHWQDKEPSRDAVKTTIYDYLYSEETGLPSSHYNEVDVRKKSDEVYKHIYRVYPFLPSPFYEQSVA